MRTLKVISWDKLRKEYHQERLRKQAWLRAIKEVIKALLLGVVVGAPSGLCWQCGGHYGSCRVYELVSSKSDRRWWCAADGDGSITDFLRRKDDEEIKESGGIRHAEVDGVGRACHGAF